MAKRKDHSGRTSDNEISRELTRAKKNHLNKNKRETDLYQEFKKSTDQYKMTFFQFKRKKEGKNYKFNSDSDNLKKNIKFNDIKIGSLSDHSIRKFKKKINKYKSKKKLKEIKQEILNFKLKTKNVD